MKDIFKNKNQTGKDFSGLDFNDQVFDGYNFAESIFNGAYFTRITFVNCDLRHTEFTESRFLDCKIMNCNLDYSDFVYSELQENIFANCSFAQVEWRESKFNSVVFKKSSFYNSTVSLCTFIDCQFDNFSSVNFSSSSKRYNVFANTKFLLNEDMLTFLKRNYGIEQKKDQINNDSSIITANDYKNDLFKLSLYRFSKTLTPNIFIELILQGIVTIIQQDNRSYLQKIKYISLICKQTIDEDAIPIFGQQLLINRINEIARSVTDKIIFMELVDLLMYIKAAQYNSIKKLEQKYIGHMDFTSNDIHCRVTLSNTYSKAQMDTYLQIMLFFLDLPPSKIRLLSYKKGSTIIEFIITASVSIGTVLLFINFTLNQFSHTIRHLVKIKKNTKVLFKGKKKTQISKELAVAPFSIMLNEGNLYYRQINNTVNHFGKEVTNIGGKGKAEIRRK